MQIDGLGLGPGSPPVVVAEMSGNHNQSLEHALQIVGAAAWAGAHALKLQTYTADALTLDLADPPFVIEDPNSPWHGKTLYELYQQAHTPRAWHPSIFERCRELGLVCFSTPFDEAAVDFLEDLGNPAYKIASFELVHLPLLRKVASLGKPVILSTGMATAGEIDEAVRTIRGEGNDRILLLKCTSTYPASPSDTDLLTIPHMRELFGCPVGLSDHTLGTGVAVAAVALGAVLVEKHLTLSRAEGGVDSSFSLEPDELRTLVDETRRAWEALGEVAYGAAGAEQASLRFRRSLYVGHDMKAGDPFTPENLRVIRPSLGLHPRYYDLVLGKRISRDAATGSPVTWDMLM